MKKYVIVDTNVWVSALITRNESSPTVRILRYFRYGYEVKETVKVEESMPDSKDIVFYAVTLTTSDKESVLVTGNSKHFPVRPFVLTPAELVDLLEK